MSANYVILPAEETDLEEIAQLVNSAYRGDTSRKGWTTEADFLDGQRTDAPLLGDALKDIRRMILCLRENEKGPILGCVALERFDDARGRGCYLGMLTVNPKLQAKGLGKILLKRAEEFAQAGGATRMTLGVIHLRESLMAWYERHGYRPTGETKPFPYGDPRAGLPKRDDLHFILFEKPLKPHTA
jgi:ribosomal protein S18 acetylase RimI-like enzyme